MNALHFVNPVAEAETTPAAGRLWEKRRHVASVFSAPTHLPRYSARTAKPLERYIRFLLFLPAKPGFYP
jgi:hypothetical protein